MKSAIVCLLIAAVFVYVSAMPADGDTPAVPTTAPGVTPPAGVSTAPAATPPAGDSTAPAEAANEPSATPKPSNPMEPITTIARGINNGFQSFLSTIFGGTS